MPLQLRRGTQAELNAITPAEGELIYVAPTGLEGQKLYVGDGITAGNALTPVTGYSNSDAKDAAAASLIAGTHKNISFSYNSTTKVLSATVDILTHETIEADAIDTAAVKDGSTIVLDVANARLFGSVTGDVVGSVFADNSTLLVDGVSGTIPATVISGTASINVIGNTTGYHTGDVKGSVFADDSGLIIDGLTGDVHATTLYMGSAQITQAGGVINVPSNTTIGGQPFRVRIATDDSTITSYNMNDAIQLIGDGGIETFVESGLIKIRTNGRLTITPQAGETDTHYIMFSDRFNDIGTVKAGGDLNYTPSTSELRTARFIASTSINSPSIGTTTLAAQTILSNGVLDIYADNGPLNLYSNFNTTASARLVAVGGAVADGRFLVSTNTVFSGGLSLAQFNQHHSTVDAVNVQWNRSRGTNLSPLAVQNGDDIADLTFGGHDGSAYQVRAAISAVVNGAVSAGTVPMRLDIATSTNGSGAPVTAVSINQNQQTTFSGAITLATYADAAARNIAIPSPSAGMMVYITSTGKFQGYNGLTTTWDDLN